MELAVEVPRLVRLREVLCEDPAPLGGDGPTLVLRTGHREALATAHLAALGLGDLSTTVIGLFSHHCRRQ